MKKAYVTVDDNARLGPIKALNGVNNGPLSIYDGEKFLFDASGIFQELEIPRVRLHDVEYPYGGERFVDYECVFPNFDLDENDPASYRFEETDRYLAAIAGCGCKLIYRLGVSIEGVAYRVKRFIGGPKDYGKFARICEHIVAHYAYGWKRGFTYKDVLWEIWNEPNGTQDMWTAGNEAYCELYAVTAKHLKSVYPNEKVGGPTVSYMTGVKWPNCAKLLECFKARLQADQTIPLDFFSFHNYAVEPEDVVENTLLAKKLVADCGHPDAMLVMDEWNYTDWSSKTESMMVTQENAAFVAANLAAMQNSPLDEASYYSAQVWPEYQKAAGKFGPATGNYRLGWNSIYRVTDGHLEKLPGFNAMLAFTALRKLGTQTKCAVTGDARVYALSATDGKTSGAYAVNFSAEEVLLTLRGEEITLGPWEICSRSWTV